MSFSITDKGVEPAFKLWFKVGDNYIFGEGTCALFAKIKEKKSLTAAAKATNMSYRYAWELCRKVGTHLGEPVLKTQRGGKTGGSSELTHAGLIILNRYLHLKRVMTRVCKIE